MTKKHSFKPVAPHVDFPKLEGELLSWWNKKGIVKKYLERNKKSTKRFSFIDGPITANNPMGVHHAWGRTYKDVWQRYHTLKGEAGRYQNGFDCQGLWVEVEVEKELGVKTKRDIENLVPQDKKTSIAKFVELCKERVRKYSSIQTEQTQRLGNFMDWEHSYYTMSDENNYMIWYFLSVCHQKGWIYKGKESVPWCPRCETAISQHEMLTEDYKEVVHKSIYLAMPLEGRDNEYVLVWTTTPWTIPANIAVAVDASFDYSLVKNKTGKSYWVAKDLVTAVFGDVQKEIKKTVKGSELVGMKYRGPFDDLPAVNEVAKANQANFHTIVATDPLLLPVTTTEGTGFVHTAVSAGTEDFKLGKKLDLPMIPVIADDATYLPNFGFLSGKNAKKHPELIFDYLVAKDKLAEHWVFRIENFKHRYPACWRCRTELVWKVAETWYIAMDRSDPTDPKKMTFREQMKQVAQKITWIPEFGLERELDWLTNMHDWLISKPNRYWGLALPIYECNSCGHFEVLGGKEELKSRAVSGWEKFAGHSPHKPWIDDVKIRCNRCESVVSRLADVGNVWLDAGIVPFSTLVDPKSGKLSFTTDKKFWSKWFPADFITESFPGQFKNWFYSLIALSTALTQEVPFKTVLGFGTLLGEDGRPMHKSWGNAIEFNEGANKIGADVMRWMYVTHDPTQNMLFGYKKADETRRKFHLLLWNIYNFFITYALIDKWHPGQNIHSENPLDCWIISRLKNTIETVTERLDNFDAYKATLCLELFVEDLSLWYVRRSRERIGPAIDMTQDKNSCYQTLYIVLVTVSQLLAPFIPFISEEMYRNLTGRESVHLADWPQSNIFNSESQLEKEMENGRKIASIIHDLRKKNNVKVRIPLKKLSYTGPQKVSAEVMQVVCSEVNVYKLEYKGKSEKYAVSGRTIEANQDKVVGLIRELVRNIQIIRKEKGCRMDEQVMVQLPLVYKQILNDEYLTDLKRKTLIKSVLWGDELTLLTG